MLFLLLCKHVNYIVGSDQLQNQSTNG